MDLAGYDKNYFIEVRVGRDDKQETYFINAALLPLSCQYLSTRLSCSVSEEHSLDLPNENPDVFDLYCEWIHNPRDPSPYDPEQTCEDTWISNAASAWLLAKRLDAAWFQRYALAQFIQTCALAPFGPWKYVETNAPPKSPLVRFSNHYIAWNLYFIGTGANEFEELDAAQLVPLVDKTTHDPRVYDIEHWYSNCGDKFAAGCTHDPIARQIKRFREENAPKEAEPELKPWVLALERQEESSRSSGPSKSSKSSPNPSKESTESSLTWSTANPPPMVSPPVSSLLSSAKSSNPPNGLKKTLSTSNMSSSANRPKKLPPSFEDYMSNRATDGRFSSSSTSKKTTLHPPSPKTAKSASLEKVRNSLRPLRPPSSYIDLYRPLSPLSLANPPQSVSPPFSSLLSSAKSSNPPNGLKKTLSTSNMSSSANRPKKLPPSFEDYMSNQAIGGRSSSSSTSKKTTLHPPSLNTAKSASLAKAPGPLPLPTYSWDSSGGLFGSSSASNPTSGPGSTTTYSSSPPCINLFSSETSASKSSKTPSSTRHSTLGNPQSYSLRPPFDPEPGVPAMDPLWLPTRDLISSPASNNSSPHTAPSRMRAATSSRTSLPAGGLSFDSRPSPVITPSVSSKPPGGSRISPIRSVAANSYAPPTFPASGEKQPDSRTQCAQQ